MLLEAAHISKRFGSRPQVLTDVSFGVEPGEFVSVIGPSGDELLEAFFAQG